MKPIPYPGLRPFQADESHLFFGREEHTSQLIEKLGNTHFIAVVGTSGCGKSSLVRAGLLADLETGFLIQAGARWQIAECRPGNHPLTSLAEAFLTKTAIGPEYSQHFSDHTEAKTFLQASLRRGPFSVHELLTEMHFPKQTNLLILVDQFEEIFRSPQEKNEIVAFVELLLTCSKHSQIYVVITMRSDFLGDCASFYGLSEAINQGLFLAPRLTREQLRAAIEGPAQVFGGQVEPALVNRLLNEAGNNSDQLPLLQHALMRLWNFVSAEKPAQIVLTLKYYEERIGKLTSALSQHAEEAFAELNEGQQKLAEILFRRLTERGSDNRDTRHPVELQEVAELAKVPWEQVAMVVEVFRQEGRNFLTPPLGKELAPESLLDISHESLIRQWQRLQTWVKEEAESAELYRRLEDSARRWETGQTRLWGTPDLEKAQAWRKSEQPTVLWAKRYGVNQGEYFDLAMRFLEESEREQQRARQERELELQRTWRLKSTLRWALGALVMAGVLTFWAVASEQKAVQATFDSKLTYATSLTQLARQEDYSQAKNILGETNELDSQVSASRHHARNLLIWFSELMGGTFQQTYDTKIPLKSLAVSADSRWLAAAGEENISGEIFSEKKKGKLAIFDLSSGNLLQWLKLSSDSLVTAIVFHPEGKWLASAETKNKIIFWSMPSGEKTTEWTTPSPVKALALSHDGKYLASGSENDNHIILWEVETGKQLRVFKGNDGSHFQGGLAFSSTGELLASIFSDNIVILWNVETGKTWQSLAGHDSAFENLTFSSDNQLLATSSSDKLVRLWTVKSGHMLHALAAPCDKVKSLRFAEEEDYLVVACDNNKLRLWDPYSGAILYVWQGHQAKITDMTTQAGQLFSASDDSTVKRWKKHRETILPYLKVVKLPEGERPTSVAIAPNGNSVAVGFEKGTLRLYSLPQIDLLFEHVQVHEQRIWHLAFNPNTTLLASASQDKTILWQMTEEGKLPLVPQKIFPQSVIFNAFSPDGHTLAMARGNGQIEVVDTLQNQLSFQIPKEDTEDFPITTVAFNATGSRLLSVGKNGDIRWWNLQTTPPTLLSKLSEKDKNNQWIAANLSPDNDYIASVGWGESIIHLYAVNNDKVQRLQRRLDGHEDTIQRIIFSPDSQQLASAGNDNTVRLWDLHNDSNLFTLRLPTTNRYASSLPLFDFDFRCIPHADCWIVVPLTQGNLIVYRLGQIYD